MSTFGPGSPDEETRIDEICRRFREEWASGSRPRIEDSVQLVAVHLKDRVLARLLQIELSERKQRGETPSIQEYCERFTEQSSIVIQVFHTTLEHDASFVSGSTVSMGEIAKTHILPTQSEADFQRSRRSGVGLDLRAGRHFGKYLLIEQLGVGGFGEVWMARNPDLDHVVALKILKPEKFTATNVEMIRKEAQILARLHAKGAKVVPIYDADRDEKGRPYLVTRFIAGGPLSDKLGSGPQEVGYWCQVIAQIADTLAVVHAAGVYHRDIKPSNILVDEEGDPHLADFGLALPTSQLELAEGAGAGTLPNASPEQAAGDLKQMDGRIDVYSLGVMLYQGLTGNLPFQYKSWAELREAGQVPNRRPRPIREQNPLVPPKLADICDRMLAFNPHERPFAADVSRLLSKAIKPPRQHLVKGVILAVVAGLLGAIGAWNLAPRGQENPEANVIQPTGRIWNTKPINEFHILTDRPELKQLDIYSHQVLAYHLTETPSTYRKLKLKFTIRFLSPSAAVGFFVGGYQKQSRDFGIPTHHCQLIFLSETSMPENGEISPFPGIDFRRQVCQIDPNTGFFVGETKLENKKISAVPVGTFELIWEDSMLTNAVWNNIPLRELLDPLEMKAGETEIRSPIGACGLFVEGGSAFLSDVTVGLDSD